jgi:hypothetical protein
MLGLFFIFFVGKAFYELADFHNKNKWVFAILGVVSYYAGEFLLGIVIGIIMVMENKEIDDSSIGLRLGGVLVGVLTCTITYQILKRQWSKEETKSNADNDVLDGDLFDRNL